MLCQRKLWLDRPAQTSRSCGSSRSQRAVASTFPDSWARTSGRARAGNLCGAMFRADFAGSSRATIRWRGIMATVDRSLVANLPLFAGFRPTNWTKSCARRARALSQGQRGVRAGRGRRIASSCCCTAISASSKTTPSGAADRGALCRARRDCSASRQAIGLQHYPATAIAVVDSVALAWPSAAWPRLVAKYPAASPPTRCRPSAAACRIPTPAWSRCRTSRSSSASRTRCCGSPSRPGARSSTASRSIFRSAGRTSPR